MGKIFHDMGSTCRDRNADEAQGYYEKALSIRTSCLGDSHPDTGQTLSCLGIVATAKAEYHRAVQLFQKCLAIQEATIGPEHPYTGHTVFDLAAAYYSQTGYDMAFDLYTRAL